MQGFLHWPGLIGYYYRIPWKLGYTLIADGFEIAIDKDQFGIL